MRRMPLLALGATTLLALSACDSRDYEGEISEIQTELQEAEAQLQEAVAENETLSGQMAEMESAGGDVPEGAAQAMNEIQVAAQRTYDRLGEMVEEPDAPAEQMEQAITALREDVQGILDSLSLAGQELGVELEQAATGAGQAAEEAAQETEGAAGEAAQETEEAVEGAAEEAGEAAEQAGDAAEQAGEEAEQETSQ